MAVLSASSRFMLGVGTEDGFEPAEGRCENFGCKGCPRIFWLGCSSPRFFEVITLGMCRY